MTKKVKLKITGMHCNSCSLLIDGDLEDLDGVKCSNTNYAKQETEIEFDEDKLDEHTIVKTIKKTGYNVVWDI